MRRERTTTLLFCAFLFGFAVLFLLFPQNSFSAAEKRALQTKPRLTVSAVLSGRFGNEVNDWYADQFPLRDWFVGVKGVAEIALGKGENNGILLGRNGQLARVRFDLITEKEIVKNTDRIDEGHLRAVAEGVNRANANAHVQTVFLFTGRSADVASSAFDYPTVSSSELSHFWESLLDSSVVAPNVTKTLQARYEAGEAVIYRTDHHWTTLGAYYGYCAVMKAFGKADEILPPSAFKPITLTEDFYGTFWASGGMKWVAPDRIEVWTSDDDGDYTMTADGKRLAGFYTLPPDGESVGYEVFLDGTHDVVTIEKSGAERPRLLVFKDSFANSLAPFLARHFDLVLLNLSSTRCDFTDLTSLSETYGADGVLVVYTMSNVMTTDIVSRFR